MTHPLPPELERDLFSAALAFRQAEPWKHMSNVQRLMMVEADGGRRTLCILGNGREIYGLQSYESSCAADFIHCTENPPPEFYESPLSLLAHLDGQELEFVSAKQLDSFDKARNGRMGHKPAPRSRQAYPIFRAFRPDCRPWHVEEVHARRLLADIRRALRWAELASTLPEPDMDLPLETRPLAHVPETLTTDRPWTLADISWQPLGKAPGPLLDEIMAPAEMIKAWNQLPLNPNVSIHLEERYLNSVVQEEKTDPPRLTRLAMAIEVKSQMIVGQEIKMADIPLGTLALDCLVQYLNVAKCRPGTVRFSDSRLGFASSRFLAHLDIRLVMSKPPQAFSEMWQMIRRM